MYSSSLNAIIFISDSLHSDLAMCILPANSDPPGKIKSSNGGSKAAVRTYPHLLTDEHDAARFVHYTTVQLVKLTLGPSDGGVQCPPLVKYGVSTHTADPKSLPQV